MKWWIHAWQWVSYLIMVGARPANVELDRAFCKEAGEPGHTYCGICPVHLKPRFLCRCPHERWVA